MLKSFESPVTSFLFQVEVVTPVSCVTASSSVSFVPLVRFPTEHSCKTSQQGYPACLFQMYMSLTPVKLDGLDMVTM